MKYKTLEDLKEAATVINEVCAMLDKEADVKVKRAIGEITLGAVGGVGGVGGSLAAVYFLGTVGFSGAGIVSGLAALGALVGGGMLAGIGVVAAAPVVLAGGGTRIAKWHKNRLFEKERKKLALLSGSQRVVLERLCEKPGLGQAIDKYRGALTRLLKVIEDLG